MFAWKRDLMKVISTYLDARKTGLTTSEWGLTFTGITIGQIGIGFIHRPVKKNEDSQPGNGEM